MSAELTVFEYMRWHRLNSISDTQGVIELLATADCDGIGIMARWCREVDGSYTVSAISSESGEWEHVTDFHEGEPVPRNPPSIYEDSLERQRDEAREELAKAQAQVLALREECLNVLSNSEGYGPFWHNGEIMYRIRGVLASPPPPVVKLEDVRPLMEALKQISGYSTSSELETPEKMELINYQHCYDHIVKSSREAVAPFLTTYPQLNS